MDATHKVGDRVIVMHNILLGNLIGTVTAIHDFGGSVTYSVDLDGGGVDHLFGFQIRPMKIK